VRTVLALRIVAWASWAYWVFAAIVLVIAGQSTVDRYLITAASIGISFGCFMVTVIIWRGYQSSVPGGQYSTGHLAVPWAVGIYATLLLAAAGWAWISAQSAIHPIVGTEEHWWSVGSGAVACQVGFVPSEACAEATFRSTVKGVSLFAATSALSVLWSMAMARAVSAPNYRIERTRER
jgi:hypothetical protein